MDRSGRGLKWAFVGIWGLIPPLAQAFDLGIPSHPSQQKAELYYSGLLEPKRAFSNSPQEAGIHRSDFLASVPVYKGEDRSVTLAAKGNVLNITPDQTNQTAFYDASLSATYARFLSGHRFYAFNVGYGSASDKPFKDSSVSVIDATALYSKPSSETSVWTWILNYSNNRPILNNIPLPGFAYTYLPSKTFRGTFGIPFGMIHWDYAEKWNLMAFALVPWMWKVQLSRRFDHDWEAYGGIDFSQLVYFPYDRTNDDDRLFYDERKAMLGVKKKFGSVLTAELESGYAFDRRFFIAENYEWKPDNSVGLSSTWFGRLGLKAEF